MGDDDRLWPGRLVAVVSVSRSHPTEPVDGVRYETGDATDVGQRVIAGADAVVATLAPRGNMSGRLVDVYAELARLSAEAGSRYLQVGGFSSLRPAERAARLVEGDVPEEYRAEALEGEATRAMLAERAPGGLDWVFVSPAGAYGSWAPGERTGNYRLGGEVALFDTDGASNISGADFAVAIVDEIENFPGSRAQWDGVVDLTDAALLADHQLWAATTPGAADTAFNVVNGESCAGVASGLGWLRDLGVEPEGPAGCRSRSSSRWPQPRARGPTSSRSTISSSPISHASRRGGTPMLTSGARWRSSRT